MRAWVDQTVRVQSEAEIEVTPAGDFEISWPLSDEPEDASRLTVLVPHKSGRSLVERLNDLLSLLPGTVIAALLW